MGIFTDYDYPFNDPYVRRAGVDRPSTERYNDKGEVIDFGDENEDRRAAE